MKRKLLIIPLLLSLFSFTSCNSTSSKVVINAIYTTKTTFDENQDCLKEVKSGFSINFCFEKNHQLTKDEINTMRNQSMFLTPNDVKDCKGFGGYYGVDGFYFDKLMKTEIEEGYILKESIKVYYTTFGTY